MWLCYRPLTFLCKGIDSVGYRGRNSKISPRYLYYPFTRTEGDASSRDSLRDSVVFLFDRCESYRLAYSKYVFLLKLQASLTFFKCLFMYTRLCVLRFQNSQTCSADSYHLISRCVYIFPFCHRTLYSEKASPTHTHKEASSSVPQYLPSPPCTEGRWGSGVRAGAKWKSLWALTSSK